MSWGDERRWERELEEWDRELEELKYECEKEEEKQK